MSSNTPVLLVLCVVCGIESAKKKKKKKRKREATLVPDLKMLSLQMVLACFVHAVASLG